MNTDSIILPLIPLRGITIFPNMIIHFDIGREKSIASLEEAMLQEGKIFLVRQKDPEVELPTEKGETHLLLNSTFYAFNICITYYFRLLY